MAVEQWEEIRAFKANRERLLGRVLTTSYRFMSELASPFLRERGYTNFRVGHIKALVNIDLEGTNINTLAQRASITKQGMSKLVKELQAEGYVESIKDPADARALIVKYTDLGIQCMVDWKDCIAHIDQKFADIVGVEKLASVKETLALLANYYEQNYIPETDCANLNRNILDLNKPL
ncbi:MAG: MarR family winged helix-turn-helix transcriptional regulator [Spirosomataceae bacterium]